MSMPSSTSRPHPNADRTALVTGAAGDLGRVIALRLAEDGYKVALTDLPALEPQLQALAATFPEARRVCITTGDVTCEADVQRVVAETVAALGPLDVMVSNVGKFYGVPVTEFTGEAWDDLFAVNVKSMMFCYKTAANQMLKQQAEQPTRAAHYRIIGGCSVAGLTGAPLCGGYAASKFAVRGLTQATAAELGPFGITVNAYAPGFVDGTRMVETLDNTVTNFAKLPAGAWRAAAIDSIKTKRMGEPRNVAAMVAYLASPDANWTTGQTLAVDGGMHLA